MKNGAFSEVKLALMVKGKQLPAETISELITLEPTRVIREGELLNRLPEVRAEEDEWLYVMPLTSPQGYDERLNDLLQRLCRRREQLPKVQELGTIVLRLSIQSDYAQMVYCLMPETLKRLADVGLPLEVSSLSWGEVGL